MSVYILTWMTDTGKPVFAVTKHIISIPDMTTISFL